MKEIVLRHLVGTDYLDPKVVTILLETTHIVVGTLLETIETIKMEVDSHLFIKISQNIKMSIDRVSIKGFKILFFTDTLRRRGISRYILINRNNTSIFKP